MSKVRKKRQEKRRNICMYIFIGMREILYSRLGKNDRCKSLVA